MKIVNREQFLKLPEYTFFCLFDGESTELGELSVKYQSFENDWLESSTTELEGDDCSEINDNWEKAAKGISVEMDLYCPGRNGMYEYDQLFMIYEKDDLIQLQDLINKALNEQ